MKIGSKLLDLSTPIVMAILNLTEDSFYEDSRVSSEKDMLDTCRQFLSEGAAILDIGAMSSRPGAKDLGPELEIQKLVPAITSIKKEFPNAIVSVDTYRSDVAQQCIDQGADIINDISGGQADPKMAKTIARNNVSYIMMHMQGMPNNMQENPQYENVTTDLFKYFKSRIAEFVQEGVKDLIIDPGFGFGKTLEHNYEILQNLDHFSHLGHPVLVGLSRKSMIYKPLGVGPEDSLNGTTALHMIAVQKGASILRVHDVAEAVEVIKLNEQF